MKIKSQLYSEETSFLFIGFIWFIETYQARTLNNTMRLHEFLTF